MHNSNAHICKKGADSELLCSCGYSTEFYGWAAKTAVSELQFDNFHAPSSFLCWKIRFKNQVTSCSDFPSEAMLWIKEVEMVDSMEELKSSRSVAGKNFPNVEMLDAKIASALNKFILKIPSSRKVSLKGHKHLKKDRFLRERQVAFMIYDYFRVTGAHDTDRNDNVQEFDTRWDGVLLSTTKIPSDENLESLYKLRVRESDQRKTVLELYDMEIKFIRRYRCLSVRGWKQW